MSSLLNVTEIESKQVNFSKKKYNKVVYHINRKDNKTINSILFRDIYKGFESKYGSSALLIRAVNDEGMQTFKSFDNQELNFEDFLPYYENKVHIANKFEYFYSMEVTILKSM